MAFLERNLEQLTVVQRQLVEQNSQLKKEAAIAERKLATRTERIRNLESLLQDSQEKLTAANHRFVDPFFLHRQGSTSPRSTSSSTQTLRQQFRQHQHNQRWPYAPNVFEDDEDDGFWTIIPKPPPPSPTKLHNLKRQISPMSTLPLTTLTNTTRVNRFEVQLQAVKDRLEAVKANSTRGLGLGAPNSNFSFGVGGPRIAKPLRGGGGGAENPANPAVQGLQAENGTSGKRSSWFFQQRA